MIDYNWDIFQRLTRRAGGVDGEGGTEAWPGREKGALINKAPINYLKL